MQKVLCTIALITLFTVIVSAEDAPESGTHRVEKLILVIDGKTRERSVERFLDIKEGDVFESEEALRRSAEREKQDLINYRVFRYVTMDVEELGTDRGQTLWMITYGVKDSWTLLPIPYPKYDSNFGFRLGLKTFYNNAFGSMTDLYLGMGMNIGPSKYSDKWVVSDWNINPQWSRIKLVGLHFTIGYLQAFETSIFNSNNPATAFHYGYHRSMISFGSMISFPNPDWRYNFSVNFDMKYSYISYLSSNNFRREPFSLGGSHSIDYGQVDWKGNFRHGQSASLAHNIRVVMDPGEQDYFLVNSFSFTGSFYRIFGRNFNYYGQAQVFAALNSKKFDVGSSLRGVGDGELSGTWGFSMNNAIGIRFWRWEGVWDAQIHPFFDIGMASPWESVDADRDLRYSTGFDLVLYIDPLPNLVARGTFGIDLAKYAWDDLRKYEFIITSTLHY